MKKKYLAILLAIMTISLPACGKGSDNSNEIKELKEPIEELKEENREVNSEIKENKRKSNTAIDSESEQPTENNEPDELSTFVAETSGVCGADLTWEYGNGILRIHGTGEMSDFGEKDSRPWEDVLKSINHIYIDEGCTRIGSYAFYNGKRNNQLSKVVLPSTLKSIGSGAFYYYNNSLKEIELPYGLESIGFKAFGYNPYLIIKEIPNTVTSIGCKVFVDTAIKEITIPDDIKAFGINAVNYDWRNNHAGSAEQGVTMITWRGKTYSGCSWDSELITEMRKAGIEIKQAWEE